MAAEHQVRGRVERALRASLSKRPDRVPSSSAGESNCPPGSYGVYLRTAGRPPAFAVECTVSGLSCIFSGRENRASCGKGLRSRELRAAEGHPLRSGVGPLGMLNGTKLRPVTAVRSGKIPADSYWRVESVRDPVESKHPSRVS